MVKVDPSGQKPNTQGQYRGTILLLFGVACTAIVMAVLIMRAPYLSDEASEQEHAAQIQADEREKLAFIEQYHPRWYDVDPHEDYDYVTYKIDVRRGNATNTLLCKGAADLHHGHWFINADDKCTRIKARVDGKKDPLPNADPAATITTA